MSARPPFVILLALMLAACGDDGPLSVVHPPPVVISVSLKLGEEVVCVESRLFVGVPVVFPLIRYGKRVWTCDLRAKLPTG